MLRMVGLLAEDTPINVVARDVGYRNAGAFTTAFRRPFGHAPTRYLLGGRPAG